MSKRRQRLTQSNRVASPPPATPGYPEYDGWKDKHPAAQPDPNWEDYANGDPSSWAEDPRMGPYPNSEHPATPWEGSDHPAAKPDHMTGITKSEWTKTEKKAYQCVRVASAMLGNKASQQQVEKQALSLMSVSDAQLHEMSRRMEASGFMLADDDMDMDDEVMGCGDDMYGSMDFDEDDMPYDSDPYETEPMYEEPMYGDIMALDQNDPEYFYEDGAKGPVGYEDEKSRMAAEIFELRAEIETLKRQATVSLEDQMLAEMLQEESQRYASEEERMLDEMLREAAKKAEEDEEEVEEETDEESDKEASFDREAEALLAEMRRQAAEDEEDEESDKKDEGDEEESEEESEESEEEESDKEAFDQDPMGLWDINDHGHDPILSQLYGGRRASDDNDEDDMGEGEEEKEASKKSKKANKSKKAKKDELEIELYPQPRLASDGVKSLGNVSKTASSNSKELEALWSSAPDVSDIF